MVSGGMSCIKYLLFCFNLLFAISGIVILVVGILAHVHVYAQYSNFVYPSYRVAPIVLIAVGVTIFIVAFFGCCGAVKENHCMIITFSVLLVVILILEVTAGIVAYVNRSEVEEMLDRKLNSTMYEYYSDEAIKNTWDVTQHELKCCGMNGPKDWNAILHNDSLPHTCCPDTKDDGSCTIKSPNVYKESCIDKVRMVLTKYATVIGGVGIGIATFQILGILFACLLARHIRLEYETV